MDQYAHFVAYACLQAYEQLQLLLSKWQAEVTTEIVSDAAKFGFQRASDRLYPGTVRLPFERNPMAEIVHTLQMQYGIAASDGEEESSRRMKTESSSRRVVDQYITPVNLPRSSSGEVNCEAFTDSKREQRSSGMVKVPDLSRDVTTTRRTRKKDMADEETPRPPVEGDEASTARIHPTRLRAISAPVFPWDKKKT